MPEIPEKLKWYQPLALGVSSTPVPWRASVDEMTGCIEIKRAPLIKMSSVMLGLLLAVIVGALFALVYFYVPIEGDERMLVICGMGFPLMMIIGIPAVDALMTILHTWHWKGGLQFRFDPRSSELFFPKENATYCVIDGVKLVVGCVHGFDMRRSSQRYPWIAQIFMLVLDKNGEWQRHNLTYDWDIEEFFSKSKTHVKPHFSRFVEKLRAHLEFEVFERDYSKDICFAQQNSNATAQ